MPPSTYLVVLVIVLVCGLLLCLCSLRKYKNNRRFLPTEIESLGGEEISLEEYLRVLDEELSDQRKTKSEV